MNTTTLETRAKVKAQFSNPYKLGDILHHSWGYDQTNCDYYQVVGVKPASVILRPIGAQTVPNSEGFMSSRLMPVRDNFLTNHCGALTRYDSQTTPERPTTTKPVKAYMQTDGTLKYYIPTPYGYCDLWDGNANYSSWYA